MSRLFLFCILIFYASRIWSADYRETINWHLQNQNVDLKNIPTPGFEGSIVVDQTGLPYWFESFDLNSSSADVFIINAVFEPILYPSSVLIDYQETELKYSS